MGDTKDKSKFVTFNSLQAIFYHIAYVVIIIMFVLFVAIILVISGIGLSGFADSNSGDGEFPAFMIVIMILLYGGIFLLAIAGIGYAIYLGVKSYQGNIVKIPIIGNIVYKKVYGESN
ncbi:MAG: hypothetical protein M3R36_12910 [Bacteroidota bacterium]|nr:hypothetical protein [Bacteroidota bacterium]